MLPQFAEPCKQALDKLLAHFNGNKSQLAAACGVSRNAISFWFSKGYVGRISAMVIDEDESIPFTKEQLRPDIRVWDYYQRPQKVQKVL